MLGGHFIMKQNTETLDTYVTRMRQVAVLLGYGEPQILEVFRNTLPNTLYWVLFPNKDLRLAVETVKRILTKEKIDRELSGQSGRTVPFTKVSGNHPSTSKTAVLFNASDRSDKKNSYLTSVMDALTSKFDKMDKWDTNLSPKYTKENGEKRPGMTLIIKVTMRLEIDPLVEKEGHHIEVEVYVDKIMARILGKIIEGKCTTITEMTLGEIAIEVKIMEIEVEA